MRSFQFASAAWPLIAVAATAGGPIDYDKLTPPLTKQPAYKSWLGPKYALLLFGKEARLRMWIVLDGETIYLDRNADGDLTGSNERLAISDCKDLTIADPDGTTRYTITSIQNYTDKAPPLTPWLAKSSLMVNVTIKGAVSYQEYCDVALQADRRRPAVAHFHGPLAAGPRTISWKVPTVVRLTTGEKPMDVFACIGTMDADHGCWVVVRTHAGDKSAFAKDVRPVVEVAFPGKTAREPTVRRRYRLEKFC